MKKKSKTLIFLIFIVSVSYAQELKPQFDFGEVTDLSLGAGIDFSINKISITASAGYGLGRIKWYGFGDDYFVVPESSGVSNFLFFNLLYIRTILKYVFFGNGEQYYLDIRFSHETVFYLPAQNPEKNIYQSDLICGDNNSNHTESGLSYRLYIKDDAFWTSLGFEYKTGIDLEYGSEYNPDSWMFFSVYHKLDIWLPLAGHGLVFHFTGVGEFIPFIIAGNVPAYEYPYMNIRHTDRYFFNLNTIYSKFELISRFIKIRAFWEMSLGVGAFFDMGIAGTDFSSYDIDDLALCFGGFLEYRINVDRPLSFPLTMHFGIKNQIDDNEIDPAFLFEMLM